MEGVPGLPGAVSPRWKDFLRRNEKWCAKLRYGNNVQGEGRLLRRVGGVDGERDPHFSLLPLPAIPGQKKWQPGSWEISTGSWKDAVYVF